MQDVCHKTKNEAYQGSCNLSKRFSLPEIVCSLRPPGYLCAKCDAVHSRAPDCMRFVTAQRFQIVLESFFYRFPCPSHLTLHYACGPFSDRFFIVFFAPGWARHRFSHDLPLNGLSFFFRFFLPGHDGDRFFILFLSFFYRFFRRLGYLCSSVFRISPHPLGSAAPPSLSPVVVLSPVL